uniref:Uncharacterized protein n=1 Tax=Heterorhabditis bacteriophora TaxID=37862 RepID=A0A1I7WJ16_HETBA
MTVKQSVIIKSPPCSISLPPIQRCYKCLERAKAKLINRQ